MLRLLKFMILLVFILQIYGCDNDSVEPGARYQEYLDSGWRAFEAENFSDASSSFRNATSEDGSEAEPFTGLGWSLMLQDSLQEARAQFSAGTTKENVGPDIYAGWAFCLNMLGFYGSSNEKALFAISLDESWKFSHGSQIGSSNLYVLVASNYFLTGEFSESLEFVKKLNPGFSADVFSTAGLIALSSEIERLSASVLVN